MNSIWKESAVLPYFEKLEENVTTDVLIIGGGMTGILCAHFLRKQGIDCVLAEGRTICSGITGNTTAKITSQHGLIYGKLLKDAGLETARMYLEANQNSVKKYEELCKNIDCDYEKKNAYVYVKSDRRCLEREAEALHKIGYEAKITETPKLPFQTAGAICFENQAQFHPLKFVSRLAENLPVYEHTFVKELKEKKAVTEHGTIAFQKLIVATHFPMDNKHGMYFLKLYQDRSYVIALRNAAQVDGMYLDGAKGGLSFRNYGEYLLLGGGGHRTGKSGGAWQELRQFAEKYYPQAKEEYAWAAQDCMTLDSIPYIGPYSPNMPDCYVAAGYQKWGMTSSMTAAMLLTDLITGKENPCSKAFHPSRCMLKGQLLVNGWEALTNLLSPSRRRCPHLGCALKWNSSEHSWDCPCHGSRFTSRGEVLDNPANGDAKWQKDTGSI